MRGRKGIGEKRKEKWRKYVHSNGGRKGGWGRKEEGEMGEDRGGRKDVRRKKGRRRKGGRRKGGRETPLFET